MKTLAFVSSLTPLYAFPESEAPTFTNWTTLRQLMTNTNGYQTVSVDTSISNGWFIFVGATAPTNFADAIAYKNFAIESEVNKIPRCDTEVVGGQEVDWINDQNETLKVRFNG